jgi:hypothetical protein
MKEDREEEDTCEDCRFYRPLPDIGVCGAEADRTQTRLTPRAAYKCSLFREREREDGS